MKKTCLFIDRVNMENSLVFADVFLLEHSNREAFLSLLVEHACVRSVSVSRAS